jgi:hypothetical protein
MTPINVAVAIPCQDLIHTETVKALIALQASIGSVALITYGSTIAAKRNFAVEGLLKHNPAATHLFFLDSDMVPPPDTITRLLGAGKAIVGALYTQRKPPSRLMAGWFSTPEGELVDKRVSAHAGLKKVHWVGGGALLIARAVCEGLPTPWFAEDVEGKEAEEIYFEKKARAAGFEVWVDTDTMVGHLGITAITPDNVAAIEKAGALV